MRSHVDPDPSFSAQPRPASVLLREMLAGFGAQDVSRDIAPERHADDEGQGVHATAWVTLGKIIDALDDTAFGIILLLLALPCCLPFVYLLPQLLALPMLALVAQMMLGKSVLDLPVKWRERRLPLARLQDVIQRAEKYLHWLERIAKPRLCALTSRGGKQMIGLLLIVPTLSILIPLPSTNTVPGIGVAISALGLVQKDGLLIVTGLLLGLSWVVLLLFLGTEVLSFLTAWMLSLFP